MIGKKFLILFLLASLAGHALLLAMTARIDMSGGARVEKVMTVELKAPQEPSAEEKSARRRDAPTPRLQAAAGLREDSAALYGPKGPYDAYLVEIRRKIEDIWSYPPEAVSRKAEGNAVIRFTITAGGKLADCRLLETSGSPLLDKGALTVVRAAAPYTPLPDSFNLSRLHITATFSYRLN